MSLKKRLSRTVVRMSKVEKIITQYQETLPYKTT